MNNQQTSADAYQGVSELYEPMHIAEAATSTSHATATLN